MYLQPLMSASTMLDSAGDAMMGQTLDGATSRTSPCNL